MSVIFQFAVVPGAKDVLFDILGGIIATGLETFETGLMGVVAFCSELFGGGFAFVVAQDGFFDFLFVRFGGAEGTALGDCCGVEDGRG
jgi:hypothetical protein